ncbi:MAG: hypothetical protein RLZZ292_4026 [Bacteroidota bacterium]
MNKQHLKTAVEQLLERNKTRQAIDLMMASTRDEARNNSILLSPRLVALEQDRNHNTLTSEQYDVKKANLHLAIIGTIDYFEEDEVIYTHTTQAPVNPLPTNQNQAMAETPSNPQLSETPSGFLSVLFYAIPKPWNSIIAVLLLCGISYGAYWYFIGSKNGEKPNEKPAIAVVEAITLTGKLVGITSHKPLSNAIVGLENNSFAKDETVEEGIFILENVKIPDNKLISLTVTYTDGTTFPIKDIDVSNLKPDANGRIDIGERRVKDFIPSANTPKPAGEKTSRNTQSGTKTMTINNKNGKMEGNNIIQAENVTIHK